MLIFDSRRPGVGKQKPKQWGPASAVRASVFENANALGIDPASIYLLMPLWEDGGEPRDLITSNSKSLENSAVWDHRGIAVDYNNSAVELTDTTYMPETFTMCLNYELHPRASLYRYIFSMQSATYLSLYYYTTARDEYWYLYNNTVKGQYVFREGVYHTPVSMILRWSPTTNVDLFYNGEEKVNTNSGTYYNRNNRVWFGNSTVSNKTLYGTAMQALIFDGLLSNDMVAMFADTPYILMQRNPRPYIFDPNASPAGWQHQIYGVDPTHVYGIENPSEVMGV